LAAAAIEIDVAGEFGIRVASEVGISVSSETGIDVGYDIEIAVTCDVESGVVLALEDQLHFSIVPLNDPDWFRCKLRKYLGNVERPM
jgi:hypothetical protein